MFIEINHYKLGESPATDIGVTYNNTKSLQEPTFHPMTIIEGGSLTLKIGDTKQLLIDCIVSHHKKELRLKTNQDFHQFNDEYISLNNNDSCNVNKLLIKYNEGTQYLRVMKFAKNGMNTEFFKISPTETSQKVYFKKSLTPLSVAQIASKGSFNVFEENRFLKSQSLTLHVV